jgi:hypothetical protein
LAVVFSQPLASGGVIEERESCKRRELHFVVKDERRFETAVGDKQFAAGLREGMTILGHRVWWFLSERLGRIRSAVV